MGHRAGAVLLAALCLWCGALPARAQQAPAAEAKAAAVVEALTGRTVFGQREDLPLPMASTTKIMTCLLALEQGGLDLPFKVDGEAVRTEGSSMGLRPGDTVTLRALCYGMMLASGNDAANAAAVRCAGSQAAFVARMNRRAARLGMTHTRFATPSGLDAPGHQSTARDMALLLRAALQNPDFCAIAGAKTARVEYGTPPRPRRLTNHNRLLWSCPGMLAGKTGFTRAAGRCLVTAVRRGGVTLVCVTLGCPDDWNQQRQLYDRCFAGLTAVDLRAAAAGLRLRAQGGGALPVTVPAQSALLPVPAQQAAALRVVPLVQPLVYAPVAAGQRVGVLECRLGGSVLWRCPLTAAGAVPLTFAPRPGPAGLFGRLRRLLGALSGNLCNSTT